MAAGLCAILDLRLSLDNSAADHRPSSWNPSHLSWHSARKTTHSRFHLILTILPLLLPLCLNTQIWPSALCDVTKGNNTTSQESRRWLCLFFYVHFPTGGRSRKASVLAGIEKPSCLAEGCKHRVKCAAITERGFSFWLVGFGWSLIVWSVLSWCNRWWKWNITEQVKYGSSKSMRFVYSWYSKP